LLLDATTGAVLSEGGWHWHAALSVTADGTTLFIGNGDSGAAVTRYSVATDAMVAIGQSSHDNLYLPQRIAALPDGSGVFYEGALFDGTNLGVERYSLDDTILGVSPDGRRALSSTTIYDVATGRRLSRPPMTASALAISPDSRTAFLFTGSAILLVDLSAF
jgi:hypothetical protein